MLTYPVGKTGKRVLLLNTGCFWAPINFRSNLALLPILPGALLMTMNLTLSSS